VHNFVSYVSIVILKLQALWSECTYGLYGKLKPRWE